MSLGIQIRPDNYMPTKNPIIYRMVHRDAFYSSLINNGSGFYLMRFTGSNVASQYSPGEQVYVEGLFGITTVTSSTFTGGNTDVVLTFPFGGTQSAGYVNNVSRTQNYHLTVQVYDGYTNAQIGPDLTFYPSKNNVLYMDISGLLDSFLEPLVSEFVSQVDYDDFVNKYYYIKYREDWTGSANAFTDDSANKRLAILGKFYVNDVPYNGLYDAFSSGGGKKWLGRQFADAATTTFTVYPAVDQNYYLSFIAHDTTNTVWIEQFDKNDVSLGGIANPITKIGVNNVKAWIGSVVDDGSYAKVWIKSSGGSRLSDIVVLRPKACVRDCVVVWRNSLGGMSTWTYGFTQEMDYQVVAGRKFRRIKAFTNQLTPDEWWNLQDINTVGETYQVAQTDPNTNSYLDGSDKQVNGSVLIEDPLRNVLTPGTVNQTSDSISTKDVRHMFSVEVLLSEAP